MNSTTPSPETTTYVPVPNYEFDVYRLATVCGESGGQSYAWLGDVLIILSQLIVSVQMVYEEKVLSGYNIAPLQAVGWEGKIR